MPKLRQIGPDDWQEWREVRLAALQDSPDAFGSMYERELAFSETDWRDRLAKGAPLLAEHDGRVVGCATSMADSDEPGTVEVYAMWVAPAARGTGAAGALIDAVVAGGRADGAKRVHLWVTETNGRARRFYERRGFTDTGERAALRSNTALTVMGMELML